MKALIKILGICALLGWSMGQGYAQESEEEDKPAVSSEAFVKSGEQEIAKLEDSDLIEQFDSSAFGAISAGDFKKLVTAIKAETPISGAAIGEAGKQYDIIIQPGHYKRTTGKTGASGLLVSERALVSYIVAKAATHLHDSGLEVLVVPADGVLTGLKTKVFLAVHADGAVNKCKVGPSLSYSTNSSLLAMHAIGFGLARAFGYEYEEFMNDNYTVNEAKYYMFSRIDASVMEGLLEVGELSCEEVENRLIEASDTIGKNVAASLRYVATADSTPQ